jgi:hypothetical protein
MSLLQSKLKFWADRPMLKSSRIPNVGLYDAWHHYVAGRLRLFFDATMAKRRHSASQKAVTDSLKASRATNTHPTRCWRRQPMGLGPWMHGRGLSFACLHRSVGTALCFAPLHVFRTNERMGTSLSKGAAFPTYSNHLMQDSDHWTTGSTRGFGGRLVAEVTIIMFFCRFFQFQQWFNVFPNAFRGSCVFTWLYCVV